MIWTLIFFQGDSQTSRNNTNVDQKEAKEKISQGDSQSSRNNTQPAVESVSGHEGICYSFLMLFLYLRVIIFIYPSEQLMPTKV